MKTYTFHKMLGSKAVVVIFSILFFFIYGCGEQKEPASQSQSSGPPESSEQKESIQFPGLGLLEVTAQAIEEHLPTLVICDATKKILLQIEMGHSDSESYQEISSIEFQVRHTPGLPDPLLMVVAAGGSGSSGRLEMALIGVVSGELKLLWNKAAYSDGGFFVGDLGKNRGLGIAQWLWKSSECHACEVDRYYIKLYLWNKEKADFDIGPKLIIEKKKFDDIKKLGLAFPNQKDDFFR